METVQNNNNAKCNDGWLFLFRFIIIITQEQEIPNASRTGRATKSQDMYTFGSGRSATNLKISFDAITAATRTHGRITKQSSTFLGRSRPMTSVSTAPQKEGTTAARSFEEIPGPTLWPIIGNLKHIKNKPTNMHRTLLEACKEHGWFYRDSVYGTKMVIIADPEIAEVLFRDEDKWPYRDFNNSFRIFFEERRALGLAKGLLERYGPRILDRKFIY